MQNIATTLELADEKFTKHPRETLDICCVADLGAFVQEKRPTVFLPGLQSETMPSTKTGTYAGTGFLQYLPHETL